MEFENSPAPAADIDVDALLTEIESSGGDPTAERPMTQEQGTPTQPTQPTQAGPTQTPQDFEITWNGKQIKAPVDKIKQWASQGYDYAQKIGELKQQQEQFQQLSQTYKQWEEKYKPIDEYIQKDPQWWDHVQQSYQQRISQLQGQQAATDPSHPLFQELQNLKSELNDVKQFKQEIVQEKEAQEISRAEEQLTKQIQSIREQYGDLDWASVDDHGKTLEMKVMEFGVANGIRDFGIAFKAFNHEALLKRAEERGKEQIAKERQRQTKLGLLGTTPTPNRGLKPAESVKEKSYEALMQEALDEIRGA